MGGLEYEAALEEGGLEVGHRLYPGLNIIVMRHSGPSRVTLRASGAISDCTDSSSEGLLVFSV